MIKVISKMRSNELINLLRLKNLIRKQHRAKSPRKIDEVSSFNIHQTGRPQKMSNFQKVAKKLKETVEEQNQKKVDIPVEAQLKVIRRERERQVEINQEYQKRKDNAKLELLKGMKELRKQKEE